jgi:SAM-dependent methyltransferase
MTRTLSRINPHYAARVLAASPQIVSTPRKQVLAELPMAPINASPVPELTSLYHNTHRGEYGSSDWPGNCGGYLIRDLLRFFQPSNVFDPMSGSGTCRDVCKELNITYVSSDIHDGIDACDPKLFMGEDAPFPRRSFDFIWIHPPYWRQKLYADDPRDLSRCPTLEAFLDRYTALIGNLNYALKPGGTLAILMGDYADREAGFVPLTYHTKRIAFECGLKQHHTDIIRFSHGASSGKKVYRSSFIPGLHDVCMLFTKPKPIYRRRS